MSISKPCALAALLFALLTCAPDGLAAAAPETPDVTFAASTNAAGELADGLGVVEYSPVQISEDGRYVSFLSASQNLGTAGPTGVPEGFVKDLDTGAVELVTRGPGPLAEAAASEVTHLLLAGDGRHVLFTTEATNLGTPLTAEEEGPHVYERDLDTGVVTLVDRVSGVDGQILARGAEGNAISADGSVVAFSAFVANLEDPSGDHTPTQAPVGYVRELASGRTEAVGRADGPAGAVADGATENVSLSPDGRFATFMSRGRNLGGGNSENFQVYLRDLAAGTTTLISRNAAGEPSELGSYGGSLSGGDGCFGVLESNSTNLLSPAPTPSGGSTYIFDRCSGTDPIRLVSIDGSGDQFPVSFGSYLAASDTPDGKVAVFKGQSGGECGCHLYLRNLDAGTTTLIDRRSGVEGDIADDEDVQFFAVAANGCRVAYATSATNLVDATPAGASAETNELYVRQLGPCVEEPTAPTSSAGSNSGAGGSTVATDGGGTSGTGGATSSGASATRTVRIARVGKRAYEIVFAGPGRARVRVQRALGGRRHGWHLIGSSFVEAPGAEGRALPLPRVPGHYRIKARLQGDPDNPTITRRFTVGPRGRSSRSGR